MTLMRFCLDLIALCVEKSSIIVDWVNTVAMYIGNLKMIETC